MTRRDDPLRDPKQWRRDLHLGQCRVARQHVARLVPLALLGLIGEQQAVGEGAVGGSDGEQDVGRRRQVQPVLEGPEVPGQAVGGSTEGRRGNDAGDHRVVVGRAELPLPGGRGVVGRSTPGEGEGLCCEDRQRQEVGDLVVLDARKRQVVGDPEGHLVASRDHGHARDRGAVDPIDLLPGLSADERKRLRTAVGDRARRGGEIRKGEHVGRGRGDVGHHVALDHVGSRPGRLPVLVEHPCAERDRAAGARAGGERVRQRPARAPRRDCGAEQVAIGAATEGRKLARHVKHDVGRAISRIVHRHADVRRRERRGRVRLRARSLGVRERRRECGVELLPIGEHVSHVEVGQREKVTHLKVERVLDQVAGPRRAGVGQVRIALLQGDGADRERVLGVGVVGVAGDRLGTGVVGVGARPGAGGIGNVRGDRRATGAQRNHVQAGSIVLGHEVRERYHDVGIAAGAEHLVELPGERAAGHGRARRGDGGDRRRPVARGGHQRHELHVARQDVGELEIRNRLARRHGHAHGVGVLEVGARRRLGLGGARGLLDPEELRLDRVGGRRTDRRDVHRGIAGRVGLKLKATCGGDVVGVIGLCQRTDGAREIDHRRRLVGAIAAEGELHDDELVAGFAGDDERRAVGILCERMRSRALGTECQNRCRKG